MMHVWRTNWTGSAPRLLGWGAACLLGYMVAGCAKPPLEPGMDGPAPSPATGEYGMLTGIVESVSSPTRSARALGESGWNDAVLGVTQTELSPALLLHTTSSFLGLFQEMKADGFEGPTHMAFNSRAGPRAFGRQEAMDLVDMEECWVVVWFSGADGWTQWDSPWAVFLQHKPLAMKLDEDGLHLRFRGPAGDVVVMPLFGYRKLPPGEVDFRATFGLPPRKSKDKPMPPTRDWSQALPRELLMRVRYWAGASRHFPLHCRDRFSVDASRDTLVMRQEFSWRHIQDDWATPGLKVAPLSPVLGLALKEGFPGRCSGEVMDMDLPTPYGPYMGVENVDAYEVAFPLLQYIHETETVQAPDTNRFPQASVALARLRREAQAILSNPGSVLPDSAGLIASGHSILGDPWIFRALPYLEGETRSKVAAGWRDEVRGAGADRFGQADPRDLETIWAYAHFTGDWNLVREHWDSLKRSFTMPAETRWVGFGRDDLVGLGDGAAPCLAMARLAYRAGDRETYELACYQFIRELVQQYVKQRGADYVREHQPWHSMEAIDEEVYLTHLQKEPPGWHIDGPRFPAPAGLHHFRQRWMRFDNEDVARFYRDWLPGSTRVELDRLGRAESESGWRFREDQGLPSLLQLRSLLLNETPDQLAAMGSAEGLEGAVARVWGGCLALLRTTRPVDRTRLIPTSRPGHLRLGLERMVDGPNPALLCHLQGMPEAGESAPPNWPRVVWCGDWRTPAGERWHFGRIKTRQEGGPGPAEEVALNWNTQVLLYR